MTYQQAILFLATLIALPDQTGSKAAILAIMQGAGLPTTSWIDGDPAERFVETMARAMAAWNAVPTQAGRAMFFALNTDPGDVDDFGVPDPSADQTPRPGWLSALGQSWFFTVRGGRSLATSKVTIKNTGSSPTSTFTASQIVAEFSLASRSDGGTPTYAGVGSTPITLAPNASATIDVVAQQLGAYGSAPLNAIDVVVTQSFGTLTATASTTATGTDREARDLYIQRCLRAPDRNSRGGPTNAYLYAMNTMVDPASGLEVPLLRFDGSGPVTITQAYVSPESAVNEVTLYFGGPNGAVDAVDVSSANANIIGVRIADPVTGAFHNSDPLGILPDTVIVLPTPDDPNITPHPTPGGASCVNTPIALTYTAKIKASKVPGGAAPGTYTTGGAPPVPVAAVFAAIASAYSAYLLSTGIGGLDQVAGVGVVFTADMPGVIRSAQSGLYDPLVTAPAGATTTIALGHQAIAGVISGTLVIV